jgi:signal transduction histidine kinase
MCAILALSWPNDVTLRLMSMYLGFQVLALFSCFVTAREATARASLDQANRELQATRELLASTARLAERERISRELHDTLGHHLTALSLNLEAAKHLPAEEALKQGRADLIAIGREALYDPNWPLHAAAALGADPEFERWPVQYGWWLTRREGLLRKLGVRI